MEKEGQIDWGWIGLCTLGGVFAGIAGGLLICLFSWSWKPFWPVALLLVCGSTIWSYIDQVEKVRCVKERRQKEYENNQNQVLCNAQELVSESKQEVDGLYNHIQAAEKYLDQAVIEFHERAFAPYWDAVESAINNLGYFDQSISKIVANKNKHEEFIVQLDNEPPSFSVSATNLPNARNTSERMRKVVRQAQKDFEFATIYEQRKTNQILVAGFGSLANAINNMTYRIEDSISSLSSAISVSFEEQNELLREQLGEINDSIKTEGKQRRDHEEKEREMLDNIQSRRKPLRAVPDSRDGNWEND